MGSARSELIVSLHKINEEIKRLMEAAKTLKQVIAQLEPESNQQKIEPNVATSPQKKNVSRYVDKFIDEQQPGTIFRSKEVISWLEFNGFERSENLHSAISVTLARRVKSGDVERADTRGVFRIPEQKAEGSEVP